MFCEVILEACEVILEARLLPNQLAASGLVWNVRLPHGPLYVEELRVVNFNSLDVLFYVRVKTQLTEGTTSTSLILFVRCRVEP